MIELQNRKGLAKYLQVRDIIHGRIISGEYAPGSLIPSESELMNLFGVAKMTIRQALAELEHDGLLRREQGRGTFVKVPEHGSGRIVVIMPHKKSAMIPGSGSLYKLLIGIMEEAHELDLEMSSFPLGLYQQEQQQLNDRNFIFPWPPDENFPVLKELAAQGKTVVLINRICNDNPNITYFSTDHYQAAKSATVKMIARGHKKIGLVILPVQDIRLREEGYRDAMNGAGLEVKAEHVCYWDRDQDNSQFNALLGSGVTAILVTQGLLLPYLMRCLDDRRINVSHDLDIITFNRIPDDTSYKPYVHEIVEPFRELAVLAVRKCFEPAGDLQSCFLKANILMKNT